MLKLLQYRKGGIAKVVGAANFSVIGLRYADNTRARRSIKNLLEKMQSENAIVVVEGIHDVNAFKSVVADLYAEGILSKDSINVVTLQRLKNNHLNISKDSVVIIAMDKDSNGIDKAEYAASIVRERCPDAKVDESTGRILLGKLGARCMEEIKGPVEEIMRG
jgi:5S rRNA maturation endonuclease (ribonuclease M5)